jgi:hypothetical protein
VPIIGLLLFAACGDADSPVGADGTEPTPGNHATVTAAAAMTQTSVGLIPTLAPIPPTVTPGGFPWGVGGFVIEGTVTIGGEVEARHDFRAITYRLSSSEEGPSSCAEWVQGVSKARAEESIEAQLYEVDAYLMLPTHLDDPASDFASLVIVEMIFRIMPYAGPGIYDSVAVFQRGAENESPDESVPDVGFLTLPRVTVRVSPQVDMPYSDIRDDTAIMATIAADGSGELTFTNLYPEAGLDGPPISGTLTWNCTDHQPEEPPTT